MGFDPDAAADTLLRARKARDRVGGLPAEAMPATMADAAAAQFALARRQGAVPPAGFKVGATARTMQDHLGIATPMAGFMPRESLLESPAALRFADLRAPGLECELVVRLARDLPAAPCSPEEAAGAVGELRAGIEIVENRYGDFRAAGAPLIVADQVFHAACVLGPVFPDWQRLEPATLAGRILVDGQERGRGVGADLLGHPMQVLAWLAGSEVAAAFGGLRAGQVVMLGSVTPPIWLDGPAEAEVVFAAPGADAPNAVRSQSRVRVRLA